MIYTVSVLLWLWALEFWLWTNDELNLMTYLHTWGWDDEPVSEQHKHSAVKGILTSTRKYEYKQSFLRWTSRIWNSLKQRREADPGIILWFINSFQFVIWYIVKILMKASLHWFWLKHLSSLHLKLVPIHHTSQTSQHLFWMFNKKGSYVKVII